MFPVAEATTDGIVEVHSVSHSFPMHGCKGSAWLDGSGKVGRQSRFGQNLPPAERIQPENLPLPATRFRASGNRNKRLAGNQKKEERNGLQTKRNFDASSVSRSFLCRKSVADATIEQTANCAPSRKSGCRQSVSGAVAVIQHPFDVGFTVEDFTA